MELPLRNFVVWYFRRALPAALWLPLWLIPSSSLPQSPPQSHSAESGFVARLKAALLLETLNAELLSRECDSHARTMVRHLQPC